jgi:hypothetical protein
MTAVASSTPLLEVKSLTDNDMFTKVVSFLTSLCSAMDILKSATLGNICALEV